MRLLPSLTKDKRIPYKFYFIVVLALILSMLLYVFPEDLDIIRYYESAEQAVTEYNDVIDFSKFWMEDHVDFMYPASLHRVEARTSYGRDYDILYGFVLYCYI